MLELEYFFSLREYDSLGRNATELELREREELERIRRRSAERDSRTEVLRHARGELRAAEDELATLDRQLAQRLSVEAKQQLETQGLALLETQQRLEVEIDEHVAFLAGFAKTLEDITQEANAQIKLLQSQRKVLEERRALLWQGLPEDLRLAYQKVAAKKLAHGVFTRLQGLHCQFCRHAVSKGFESEVDTLVALKACPGCGRLVLPYKAVAG